MSNTNIMDKIKEVQQILNNHSLPADNGGFIRDSLDGSKFNKIAQDIVKLFDIPDVMCSHEKTTKHMKTGIRYCSNPKCQKLIDVE